MSALAQALSRDSLRADARKDAYRKLFAKLDGLLAQHKERVAAASKGILQVEGETLVVRVVGGEVREHQTFVEAADEHSVEADFKAACRALTADLARKYADHIARRHEDDDGLFDAHVKVAALAQVGGVSDELDREADELSKKWFGKYRVAIKGLTDEPRFLSCAAWPSSPPRTGESFHRIESVARMNDGTLRVMDLTDPSIREAITEVEDIQALYLGGEATDY